MNYPKLVSSICFALPGWLLPERLRKYSVRQRVIMAMAAFGPDDYKRAFTGHNGACIILVMRDLERARRICVGEAYADQLLHDVFEFLSAKQREEMVECWPTMGFKTPAEKKRFDAVEFTTTLVKVDRARVEQRASEQRANRVSAYGGA